MRLVSLPQNLVCILERFTADFLIFPAVSTQDNTILVTTSVLVTYTSTFVSDRTQTYTTTFVSYSTMISTAFPNDAFKRPERVWPNFNDSCSVAVPSNCEGGARQFEVG